MCFFWFPVSAGRTFLRAPQMSIGTWGRLVRRAIPSPSNSFSPQVAELAAETGHSSHPGTPALRRYEHTIHTYSGKQVTFVKAVLLCVCLYLSALSSDPIVTKLDFDKDATPKHFSPVSIREVLPENQIPNKEREQVTSHTIMWLL